MAGVAMVVVAAGSAAAQSHQASRARQQAGQQAQDAAAAADPAAGLRPIFQDDLLSRWRGLSSVNPAEITNDPNFKFQQEQGMTGIKNQASAAGLLRSGTLLEDMSKFNQDLSSTFIDKQFGRNMQMLNVLGNFSGLNMGNPGAAGGILGNSATNLLASGNASNNQMWQQAGGIASQIGRLIPSGGSGAATTGYSPSSDGFAGP